MDLTAIVFMMALSGGPTENAQEIRQPARALYVCDRDLASARAFEREHGVRPQFVSADEATTSRERWSAPRCISDGEHRKLAAELERRRAPQQRASRD